MRLSSSSSISANVATACCIRQSRIPLSTSWASWFQRLSNSSRIRFSPSHFLGSSSLPPILPSFLSACKNPTHTLFPVEVLSLLKNPKGWWFVMKDEEDYVRKGNHHHDGNKGAQCRPIDQHFTRRFGPTRPLVSSPGSDAGSLVCA